MTAKANLSVSLTMNEEGANAYGGPYWSGLMSFIEALSSGTTAGKFDIPYMAERTVAESTNDDLDLAGVLSTALGTTVAAAEIVAIMIINAPKDPAETANLSALTIGGEGTNPFEGFLSADGTIGPIKPGGMFLLWASDAAGLGTVVAGTGDILRIANGAGGAAKYQIAVLARTA